MDKSKVVSFIAGAILAGSTVAGLIWGVDLKGAICGPAAVAASK